MEVLVVVQPFGEYPKGAIITDALLVAGFKKSEFVPFFVRVVL